MNKRLSLITLLVTIIFAYGCNGKQNQNTDTLSSNNTDNQSENNIDNRLEVNINDLRLMPAEGGQGTAFDDGANWSFWNKGAQLKWKNPGGDYLDKDLNPQGNNPWSSQTVSDTDSAQKVSFDVSDLISNWVDDVLPNRGFLLKHQSGSSGPLDFATKEHENIAYHPKLIITTLSNDTYELIPIGDTRLTSSTKTLTYGQESNMRVRGDMNSLIWFDLTSLDNTDILEAHFEITTTAQYTNSDSVIGIYSTQTDYWDSSDPIQGLAANYEKDEGIEFHSDVLLHYDFDSADESSGGNFLNGSADSHHSDNIWSCQDPFPVGRAADGTLLQPDTGIPNSEPLKLGQGSALCTRLKYEEGPANTQGLGNYGMSLRKAVSELSDDEHTDELYVRIYLYLGDTWGENILNESGKRPGGISGTYSQTPYAAGWGGRTTNGSNGWSARGGYIAQVPYGYNPLQGHTTLATYLYHADQPGGYGEQLNWDLKLNGSLEKGRWYSIEQYVKVNTTDGNNLQGSSGNNDGIVRGWVDGRLAFEKTGVRFTDMDYIKIQTADFGLYYGGFGNTPFDQHMAIDDIVISRSYIGPKN